jgi:hypothetical protein
VTGLSVVVEVRRLELLTPYMRRKARIIARQAEASNKEG